MGSRDGQGPSQSKIENAEPLLLRLRVAISVSENRHALDMGVSKRSDPDSLEISNSDHEELVNEHSTQANTTESRHSVASSNTRC